MDLRPTETEIGTVLLVVGAGGFTHATPVLELGRILANRGHHVDFATHKGQQKWIDESTAYSFIRTVHLMGDPMDKETEAAHYAAMQETDQRKDYAKYFAPKVRIDSFWTSDYQHLKKIVSVNRPDVIVADFFVEVAVRDIQYQTGIPVATVWPQMPWGLAGASHIPGIPGFQVDALTSEDASLWTRLRAALRPLRSLRTVAPHLRLLKQRRKLAGVDYVLPTIASEPDHLVLVNAFWGWETPKALPPLMATVGPILPEEYAPIADEEMQQFFSDHSRVVYVSFGTHIHLQPREHEKLLTALSGLMLEDEIDGVIWTAKEEQRALFSQDKTLPGNDMKMADVLANKHPSWHFTSFAPQRAILDHEKTILFLSHGGGSSVAEGFFHGTPMLVLGMCSDQPLNGLRVQHSGAGLALDKASFSAEEMLSKARFLIQGNRQGIVAQDVQRMKLIARVSARKKAYGADLVEEIMYDGKYSFRHSDQADCETKMSKRRPMHLQTAAARMSAWKAKNWDLTVLGVLSFAGVTSLGYFAAIYVRKHA